LHLKIGMRYLSLSSQELKNRTGRVLLKRVSNAETFAVQALQ